MANDKLFSSPPQHKWNTTGDIAATAHGKDSTAAVSIGSGNQQGNDKQTYNINAK